MKLSLLILNSVSILSTVHGWYSRNGRSKAMIHTGTARTSTLFGHWNEPRARTSSSSRSISSSSSCSSSSAKPSAAHGKLVFLVPADETVLSKFGSTSSPVGRPLLREAVYHLGRKINSFVNDQLDWDVVSLNVSSSLDNNDEAEKLYQADMLVAIGMRLPDDIQRVKDVFEIRRQQSTQSRRYICHFALDCSEPIPSLVGSYDPTRPSKRSRFLPWTGRATSKRLHSKMTNLLERWTSDDFSYALMLFMNQFSGTPVEWVRHRIDASWEKGAFQNSREFIAMMTHCGDCAIPCLQDTRCRECLGKLMRLDPRDQANSYRTLVSYESDLLTQFSLCIFTKHNIFQCDAKIPTIPKVQPLQTWRGRPMDESDARALLVGHLDDAAALDGSLCLPISWKVACGANAAYDQFPSQNQIFYPAARGRDMWYDPVFRVETLDGRHFWCHRHYKVRPGKEVATFRLSVLDNGVTTNEFWTIVGAADDLSWIVFHYAGAAKAVGLSYLGGLLCTPDGGMPDESQLPIVWNCMRKAGIQPWELNRVDNRLDTIGALEAGPPPLDLYRNHSFAMKTTTTPITRAAATIV